MKFSLCLSHFLSFFLFLLHFHSSISSSFSSNYSSSTHLCAPHQSLSLLQFKQSFPINSSASSEDCQYPKTESWKEGTDCCLWDGVTCDVETGQVTGLNLACSMLYGILHSNSSLFSLHHLQKLDLSYNDFNSSRISSQFGHFSNLTHLNLSSSNFAGQVSSEISHLSKLVSLDLSENYYPRVEPISFDKLVRNLTKLRELDLSWVDMSLVVSNSLMNLSSSLSSLKLFYCRLQGKFPSSMGKLKHLQYLNLGQNNFTGSIPYDFEQLTELVSLDLFANDYLSLEPISFDQIVQNLTKLRVLDLDNVNMSLVVPNSLTNLSSSLSSLSLYNCGLQGKFPFSMGKFKHLQYLKLGLNNFTGSLSYDFEQLTELVSLDLYQNRYLSLEPISFDKILQNLTKLRQLDLGSVNMSLIVPNSLTNLSSSLSVLYLDNCGLQGKFRDNIFLLPNLRTLYLSYNDGLIGSFPSSNLSNVLSVLDLSNTRFSVYLEKDFFSNLKSLEYMFLRNCNIIRSDLSFLGNLTQLNYLALSSNNISGQIPSSLGNLMRLRYLDLASNNFMGGISSSICNLKFLRVLNLFNNSLSGFIPQCLGNFNNILSVLHLCMNNLRGVISLTFSKGNTMEYLNLNGNELEGKIPLSIINCTMLEFLDLGNNKIEDKFPYFLGKLPELQVLILKSNKLQGFVKSRTSYSSFSKLRIFIISSNNLSGPLPTGFFNSLEAMIDTDQNMIYMTGRNYSGYVYSLKMIWKGLEIEFVKILTILKVIDLSNNRFNGEIPKQIGNLKGLQQLNLSHNFLVGHIQSSLAYLTNLESLDLSSNLLTGRIPMQLGNLTFLQVLNLSHNQLEGPIPKGNQFNTFSNGSFEGNLGLCGFPMPKECNSGETPPLPPLNFIEGDDFIRFGDGFGWKAVTMGYGCGFVFGVMMGYVVFRTRRPAWFLKIVEDQWNLKGRRIKKNARRNGTRRN